MPLARRRHIAPLLLLGCLTACAQAVTRAPPREHIAINDGWLGLERASTRLHSRAGND